MVPIEECSENSPRVLRRVISRYTDVVCESRVIDYVTGRQARAPHQVADLLRLALDDEPTEVFVALLLSSKHFVTGFVEVSRGTLTTSLVHPREVFGPALRMNAAAIVVAHNHPSGDPEPSAEDLEVTRRLHEAGSLLGVPMLDHVVLGESGRHVSLRERMKF